MFRCHRLTAIRRADRADRAGRRVGERCALRRPRLISRCGSSTTCSRSARWAFHPWIARSAEELNVDTKRRRLTAPDGTLIHEGDVISVDGSSGLVYAGEVPVAASPVVEYFEGSLDPAGEHADDLVRAVHQIRSQADEVRRLGVRANADTVEDAERARRFGGEGIGLCRTPRRPPRSSSPDLRPRRPQHATRPGSQPGRRHLTRSDAGSRWSSGFRTQAAHPATGHHNGSARTSR